ncbi:hypothetical protein GCM10007897_35280 [Sphingobium jiangsuense]|uniref:Uncharacterized protein n=1 Tax=Sphingobium jiangsuense TaxID=870476 RepID=A0A7W6BMP3_9SPHN|nr:hypothetical protein [Sphingobium jiangsuense]MBB3924534.1 hypothetical protein [Sphingobium jiangsuense]GLT02124.1 hypothetical protein GCM10007897_35280 [Sphingobium jiangsuense]
MAMAETPLPPVDPDPHPMHRSTDETRAGTTPHIVRYVLGISLALALVVMTIIYLWGIT